MHPARRSLASPNHSAKSTRQPPSGWSPTLLLRAIQQACQALKRRGKRGFVVDGELGRQPKEFPSVWYDNRLDPKESPGRTEVLRSIEMVVAYI